MSVENNAHKKVVSYLKHLGLTGEQAQIYLFLLQHGPGTVLTISRGIKTGRTKLYPLLDSLADKQLITVHERHYGTSYEAQPPDVLEFLVIEHERQAEQLRASLPAARHYLQSLQLHSPTTSRVVEYRGIDGLKQMNFNLTKAHGEYRVFELAGLDKHLGNHFASKIRSTLASKQLHSYDLTNNPNRDQESGVDSPNAHVRYIDPQRFCIQFETYIYNNCTALLSYHKDDIFGVEIHNQTLAAQQIQLFDLLWSQAVPLTVTQK